MTADGRNWEHIAFEQFLNSMHAWTLVFKLLVDA